MKVKLLKIILFNLIFVCPISIIKAGNLNNNQYYIIQDIIVEGNDNISKKIILSLAGLEKGDVITLSDNRLNEATKKIWERRIVNDIKIEANIISTNKLVLIIKLITGKTLVNFKIEGVSEKIEEEIIEQSKLFSGICLSQEYLNTLTSTIKNVLAKKEIPFPNIELIQSKNSNTNNGVDLIIRITGNTTQKIHRIYMQGNRDFTIEELAHKMISTKQVRRKGLFRRFLEYSVINILHIYKKPEYRKIKKCFFKDEFYILYANLFGSTYKRLALEADLERIKKELYHEYGYIDASVEIEAIKRFDKQAVDIYLKLYEGERYFVNDIKWSGNKIFSTGLLNSYLGLRKGEYFNSNKFKNNLFENPETSILRGLYHNRGYFFSTISFENLKIEGNKIDVLIKIHEGKEAIIDRVNIIGSKITKDVTIRKYLKTIPGNKYRNIDVLRSRNELGRIGIIRIDKFRPYPIPNFEKGTVDLEYVIHEDLDVGVDAQFGKDEYGFQGKFGGHFNNLSIGRIFNLEPPIGGGQSAKLTWTKSQYHKKYEFEIYDPWVFIWGRYPISAQFSIYNVYQAKSSIGYITKNLDPLRVANVNKESKSNNDPLSTEYANPFDKIVPGYEGYIKTKGFSIGIGKRLSWMDDINISFGFSFDKKEYKEYKIFPNSDKRYTSETLDLSFSFGITKDNTDQIFYPTEGHKINLKSSFTPPYSLIYDIDPNDISSGKAEYNQLSFNVSKYKEFLNQIVFVFKFDFGCLLNYSNKYDIGPYRRYHLGGDGTPAGYNSVLSQTGVALRGYPNSFLAPKDNLKNEGGVFYDKICFELRHKINQINFIPVYVLIFFEAGNTWAKYEKFKIDEIFGYKAFGLGIRTIIPFIGGPMGLNIGFGLDKKTQTLSPEIHFTTGLG